MSKFSDYFNSLKNGETVENKISVSEIIQHISQRWRLSIPKTNAEKQQNPTFIAIANNLTKMVIPFDFETKSQAIVAYGRYRGIIICIAHHKTFTNDKLRILAFIPNKLMGSAKISKLFLDKLEMKVITPQDISKIADEDEDFQGFVINPHSQNFNMDRNASF